MKSGLLKVTRLQSGSLKPDVFHSRWLVFLPVALFALFAPAKAEASQTGLLVRGYQIDQIPPTKSDLAYPLCGSSVEPFINATWDYEQNLFGDCGWDSFMLHYTGYIQIPEHETIEFWVASDDGGTVKIGVHEFGNWQDQGCSATETGLIDIEAGTQTLDAWFYENGGGTCFMLAWNVDDTGWVIVQPEFFTSEPLTPETTSTLETTTTEATTTTSTTTTSLPTTTAAPETTTTLPQTTSSTTLYVSSTTSLLDQPTTTQPTPEVSSSTSPQTTTTTSTTTTTLFIPPSSLLPQPSLPATTEQPLLPEQTLPLIPEPTTSVQTTQPVPVATTSTMPSDPSTSVPKPPETSTSVEPPTTTTLPSDEPITAEQFSEALTALSDANPDQITEIVTTNLDS